MQGIIASQSDVFPQFKIGDCVDIKFSYLSEGQHAAKINDVEYTFEIKKIIFLSNENMLLEGFLVEIDSNSLSRFAIELIRY